MSCSCASIGMASRVGRSVTRPAALSVSTEIHETGWPRDAGFLGQLAPATSSRLDGRHADLFARHDPVGRDVHPPAVHLDVTVRDELARRLAARREAHPVHDVVQPALERHQQVGALDARLRVTPSNVLRNWRSLRPYMRLIFCFSRSCLAYSDALRRRPPVWPCWPGA